MRFGINLNVIEMMTAASAGIALSYYLQTEQEEEMNTDNVIHALAAVGSYALGKGLYTLARGIRTSVTAQTAEESTPPLSHKLR